MKKQIKSIVAITFVVTMAFSFIACSNNKKVDPTPTLTPTPVVTETPTATPTPEATAVVEPVVIKELEVLNKTVNLSEGMFIVEIEQPNVEIKDQPQMSDKINQIIDDLIMSELNNFYEYSKTQITQDEAEEAGIKYGFDVTHDVFRADEKLISINIVISQMTGTAHPYDRYFSINIDPTTGELVELNNLFIDNFDYETVINSAIKKMVDEKKDIGIFDSFNPVVTESTTWVVTNESIKILYVKGEVAPYAADNQEVVIPLSDFEKELNVKFFSK